MGLTPYERFTKVLQGADDPPCVENPDAFFPEDGNEYKVELEQRRIAKSLCEGCPLVQECLLYAIEGNELFGIWGGLTYRQRMELKRKWRV